MQQTLTKKDLIKFIKQRHCAIYDKIYGKNFSLIGKRTSQGNRHSFFKAT